VKLYGAYGEELLVIKRVNELRFRLGLPLGDWWSGMREVNNENNNISI
jgi:hypothetical protein